jgi:protein-disulfide isomerase
MRVLALLPLAILAACSGEGGTGNASAPAGGTVAAAPAPAGQAWTETVVKTPEGGFRMGNPAAAIKVIEYGSRTCPTCGAFGREAPEGLHRYVDTGKVSYEFRDFLVHGAPDLSAALIGQCGGTAPFFPLLDQMYAGQDAILEKLQADPNLQAKLTGAKPAAAMTMLAETMGLIDFAKQRGLPEAKVRACLADQPAMDALVKQSQDAQTSGTVTGTPTFLVNGEKQPDVVSWPQLEAKLKAAGA